MMLSLSVLGLYYFILSFLGGLMGFSFSMVIRVELNNPFSVLGGYFYYVALTSHGFMMVFYFLTILASGFYNLFLANFSFLMEISLSSLGVIGFYLTMFSLMVVLLALFIGEGVNCGWTLYTPLSNKMFNSLLALDLLIVGLNIFLVASILTSCSIIIVAYNSFFNFESYLDIPVFTWSFLLTSLLNIFSMPSLIGVMMMLLLDSNFGTYYFDGEFGGSSVLFQSMFWIWGHPEVYIMMLPVFGMISQTLEVICGGFLYNKSGIMFSMMSLFLLSFLVWGHHMMSVGWSLGIKGFFMVSTLMMSLPTGVKVFSWLYTLVLYGKSFNMMSGFVSFFMLFFSLGGVTGVFLANYSLDAVFHDGYFVVGHFHTILAGASVSGLFSGFFTYFKSIFMFKDSSALTNLTLVIGFVGVNMSLIQLLLSMHILGLMGVPSSVFGFSFESYLLFHMGSVGFLEIWLSLSVLLFSLLCVVNLKLKDGGW